LTFLKIPGLGLFTGREKMKKVRKVNLNLLGVFVFSLILNLNLLTAMEVWVIDETVHINPITGKAYEENSQHCPGGISGDYKTSNWIWNKSTKTIDLFAARNEAVAIQIIIERAEGETLTGVNVEVSELKSGSNILAQENVELFREWYVYVANPSQPVCSAHSLGRGWYPDALIPASTERYGLPFNLPSDDYAMESGERLGNRQKNQAVWIDLTVPLNQPPGIYRGTITITANNGSLTETLHLNLAVKEITLPLEKHSTFELMSPSVPGGRKRLQIYQIAQSHRLTVIEYRRYPLYTGSGTTAELQIERWVNQSNGAYKKIFTGEAFTKGICAGAPVSYWVLGFDVHIQREPEAPSDGSTWPRAYSGQHPINQPFPTEYVTTAQKLMRDFVNYFEANFPQVELRNWANGFDEPHFHKPDESSEEFLKNLADRMNEFGKIIDDAVGDKIKNRIDIGSGFGRCRVDFNGDGLESPPCKEVVNYLKDRFECWNVGTGNMNVKVLKEANIPIIQCYSFDGPKTPPLVVDESALGYIITGWIQWKYQVDAGCVWRFMRGGNPFREVSRGFEQGNCEENFIYRLRRLTSTGQELVTRFAVKGVRRGLQDYEYFYLLSQLGKKAQVDAWVNSLIQKAYEDVSAGAASGWRHHPRDYFNVRKQVAEEIVKLALEKKGQNNEIIKSVSYPNPLNPECYIPVNAKGKRQNVKCKIYNILGQLVREIEYSMVQGFKSSRVYWDGKDSRGMEVPSGVYFYEIGEEKVKRMVVLR
jgi:hypothetical protein